MPKKIVPDRFHEARIHGDLNTLVIVRSYSHQPEPKASTDAGARTVLQDAYKDIGTGIDIDTKTLPKHLDPHPKFPLARVQSVEGESNGDPCSRLVYTYVMYRLMTPVFRDEITDLATSNHGYIVGTATSLSPANNNGILTNVVVGPVVMESQTSLQQVTTDSKFPDGWGSTAAIRNGSRDPVSATPADAQNKVPIQVPWIQAWNPDVEATDSSIGAAKADTASGYTEVNDIEAEVKVNLNAKKKVDWQPARIEVFRPIDGFTIRHYAYIKDITDSLNRIDQQIQHWKDTYIGSLNSVAFVINQVTYEARTVMVYNLTTTTPDNGASVLLTWQLAVKPVYGYGMEGGWDPWVSAVDTRTGTTPQNARKVMDLSGVSDDHSQEVPQPVSLVKTNGYVKVLDARSFDFAELQGIFGDGFGSPE